MKLSDYQLTEKELALHNIITDIRGTYTWIEVEVVVHDIARLNYIKMMIEKHNINFNEDIIKYRDKLLKYLEKI